MARRLDYWAKADTFAWLDEREEEIFDRYLELGKVNDLVAELGAQCGGLSGHTFYAWLEAEPDRWANWERAKKVRGHYSADQAMAEAEAATPQDANARRLKYEAKMRAAEWQNREVFGKRPEIQVAIGVGGEWASALQSALGEPALLVGTPVKQVGSGSEVARFDSFESEPHTEQYLTRGRQEPCQPGGLPSHPSGEPGHDDV